MFFSRRAFERHAIEKELIARRAKKKPGVAAHGNSGMKLVEGDVQLLGGPHVVVAVEPGKLQQNVETSHKGAAGGGSWIHGFHATAYIPRGRTSPLVP